MRKEKPGRRRWAGDKGRPARRGRAGDFARQLKEDERWVFGRHVVEEVIDSRRCRVLSLWAIDGDKYADLLRRVRKRGTRVSVVPKKELDRITNGGAHQGLAAKIADKPGAALEDYLEALSPAEKAKAVIVVLDQIQDPHNFGAISRSAVCLGASALVYPQRRSAPLTQAVHAASAGAISKIKTFSVVNLAQTLELFKRAEFWIYGADVAGRPLAGTRFNRPLVLVIGSEGQGIRPLVRRCCDELVSIPQAAGGVQSLNASCAASVLLYEAARQGAKG
ncbi:MAG: 23S rRNA (guanosine(2251)-2'-O)-methyltransferase RlmB [Elusimicrobiota bacterium]